MKTGNLKLGERQAFLLWMAVCADRRFCIPFRIKADLFKMFGGTKSRLYKNMMKYEVKK